MMEFQSVSLASKEDNLGSDEIAFFRLILMSYIPHIQWRIYQSATSELIWIEFNKDLYMFKFYNAVIIILIVPILLISKQMENKKKYILLGVNQYYYHC
ncbi:MAG: hypothetical protein OEY49_17935 [Candidatus Heimdallarchaeota archaeon]|nr:hypothetical protein [Candidatus Heimdallarchaeota archaeon]